MWQVIAVRMFKRNTRLSNLKQGKLLEKNKISMIKIYLVFKIIDNMKTNKYWKHKNKLLK